MINLSSVNSMDELPLSMILNRINIVRWITISDLSNQFIVENWIVYTIGRSFIHIESKIGFLIQSRILLFIILFHSFFSLTYPTPSLYHPQMKYHLTTVRLPLVTNQNNESIIQKESFFTIHFVSLLLFIKSYKKKSKTNKIKTIDMLKSQWTIIRNRIKHY